MDTRSQLEDLTKAATAAAEKLAALEIRVADLEAQAGKSVAVKVKEAVLGKPK